MGFSIQIGWFWILVIVIIIIVKASKSGVKAEEERRMAEESASLMGGLSGQYEDETADKVIQAIFTRPQPELYERGRHCSAEEEFRLWMEKVGDCFTEEGFRKFLDSGTCSRYLKLAEDARSIVKVIGMDCRDGGKTMDVVVQVNAEDPVRVRAAAEYAENMLLEDLKILDDTELTELLGKLKK